jgi:hypothetical protein
MGESPRPQGTITTLLFTDVGGSTRLLQALGDRYTEALAHISADEIVEVAAGKGR